MFRRRQLVAAAIGCSWMLAAESRGPHPFFSVILQMTGNVPVASRNSSSSCSHRIFAVVVSIYSRLAVVEVRGGSHSRRRGALFVGPSSLFRRRRPRNVLMFGYMRFRPRRYVVNSTVVGRGAQPAWSSHDPSRTT